MKWIIETFITIIHNVVLLILDFFGQSVIQLLTFDVGSSSSVFSIVFNAVLPLSKYLSIFAMVLLFINYLWQLIRTMTAMDGAGETPLGLTARTLIAGICISASYTIIRIVEQIFAKLYGALLSAPSTSWSFTAFATDFAADLPDTLNVVSAVGSLVGLVISLIFVILIGGQFIAFLLEVVERYIVLNILYYTSPLAFAMAGSKSTSQIFSNWVRMVLSQMMLMCFNVFFYRLFIAGFSRYSFAMTELEDAIRNSPFYTTIGGAITAELQFGMSMIWNLMMFSILYVATRMDSYMSTLGLSTAQTGRGLGAAIIGTAMSVATVARTGKAIATPIAKAGGRMVDNHRENNQTSRVDHRTGGYDADTMKAFGTDKLKSSSLTAMDQNKMATAIRNMDMIPKELRDNIVPSSIKQNADKSGYTWETADGKRGQLQYLSGMDADKKADITGRSGVLMKDANGNEMFMTADGKTPEARNAAMEAMCKSESFDALRQDYELRGGKVTPLYDENGNFTGVYDFKDPEGKMESYQMASSNLVQPAPGSVINAAETLADGTKWYKSDTTAPAVAENMPTPGSYTGSAAVSAAEKVNNELGTNFAMVTHVGENGVTSGITQNGQSAVVFPTSKFDVPEKYDQQTQTLTANNGAHYAVANDVPVPSHVGGAQTAFTPKETEAGTPVADNAYIPGREAMAVPENRVAHINECFTGDNALNVQQVTDYNPATGTFSGVDNNGARFTAAPAATHDFSQSAHGEHVNVQATNGASYHVAYDSGETFHDSLKEKPVASSGESIQWTQKFSPATAQDALNSTHVPYQPTIVQGANAATTFKSSNTHIVQNGVPGAAEQPPAAGRNTVPEQPIPTSQVAKPMDYIPGDGGGTGSKRNDSGVNPTSARKNKKKK